uniref:Uncharacterized protein n=1 Tax=Arundo donax TaxID=35708 RepID=A0A0A9DAB3_ARUDO
MELHTQVCQITNRVPSYNSETTGTLYMHPEKKGTMYSSSYSSLSFSLVVSLVFLLVIDCLASANSSMFLCQIIK